MLFWNYHPDFRCCLMCYKSNIDINCGRQTKLRKKRNDESDFLLQYWQQKVFEDLSKHANMQTNPTSSKLLANICFDCARFDWLP